MKKTLVLITIALTLSACVKHEEVSFSGQVVGIRNCTLSMTDANVGYIVQLETPENIGGTAVSSDGQDTMRNLVVLYDPPKIMQVSTRLHGSFYFDEKYSKAKGCISWNDNNIGNLPEGVFTEVVVD